MTTVKGQWLWELTGSKGSQFGYVTAWDPHDAVSRALTSDTGSGNLLGTKLGASGFEVLHDAPGNFDDEYVGHGDGFSLRVKRIACPMPVRIAHDVKGCGSTQVAGPDEEGLFDCCTCGVFFNPRTAH